MSRYRCRRQSVKEIQDLRPAREVAAGEFLDNERMS